MIDYNKYRNFTKIDNYSYSYYNKPIIVNLLNIIHETKKHNKDDILFTNNKNAINLFENIEALDVDQLKLLSLDIYNLGLIDIFSYIVDLFYKKI